MMYNLFKLPGIILSLFMTITALTGVGVAIAFVLVAVMPIFIMYNIFDVILPESAMSGFKAGCEMFGYSQNRGVF